MIDWIGLGKLKSKSFICGHCGNPLASEKGWSAQNSSTGKFWHIYICHHCIKPTFFDEHESQTPGIIFGNDVNDINDEHVEKLYTEARKCTNNNSFTASVLCCRKLLMHIAVARGAKDGLKFIEYVEYLSAKNYIPPDAKDWVDHIREKGNEANHEITIMAKEDAEDLIAFSEMLLKLIYEFPANVKRKRPAPTIPQA
ncbi:DUF4145 domain-containing protein [Candidatus Gracilibacteria bacterium]|nr:DUF4145 domain-containing protein [Candidatus Gracilibacteria bacterium]